MDVGGLARLFGGGGTDEGGGATAPAWVPANAKIHIDLVGGTPQGRAWVDGSGEVAVATLLGNDPAVDAAWGTSGYASGDLTADGYDPATFTAFIGAARTRLLAGATVRWVQKQITLSADLDSPLLMISADGADGLEIDLAGGLELYSLGGSAFEEIPTAFTTAVGSTNVLAYTVTATRLEAATNGFAPIAAVLDATDRPSGNPLVGALFDYLNNYAVVRAITIYDPLPTTAGLSELSQLA